MKIAVFVKQVPDTASRIVIAADGRSIEEAGLSFVISPYDEFALEEALRLKDRDPGTEVIAVSLGEERAQNALRTCLAMGADRAVLVRDDRLRDREPLVTARALCAAVRGESCDLLLFGHKGVGTDHGQVGILAAEILGLPHAGAVVKLSIEGREVRAEREIEGAHEHLSFRLPAVVTAQKGLNEPRYASLKGIMAAKKKTIEVRDGAALGLEPKLLEPSEPRLRVVSLRLPPPRAAGRRIEGDPESQARELVRLLREEARAL
jgi:electron transfer flavoprotein beta subunit